MQPHHFAFSRKMTLDDFRMLKLIGRGSFGQVWQVELKATSQVLALKILKKKDLVARKQVAHTRTERRILANLSHPFLVSLRFAFQTKAKLYLVTGDVQQMYHNILHAPIPFYVELFSKPAMALISALLEKAPGKRAGCVAVKRSAFMRGVDWDKLLRKEVADAKDTRNFDGVEFSARSRNREHGYLKQTPSFTSHSLIAAQGQFPNFTYDESEMQIVD